MSKVLIINPYYIPGFRSGGPQRTIENLVDVFGEENEIYILTQDHDLGISEPYKGIQNDKWIQVGNAKVMYVSSEKFKWEAIKKAYMYFNVIYSCGLFEQNSIALLLIHRMNKKKYRFNKKIYIAPMGVFSSGAFNNASHKKKMLFINTYKLLGAFKDIIWSFTTESEVSDAEKVLGYSLKTNNYIIAEDLPRKVDFDLYRDKADTYKKKSGQLNIVFISRIVPQKNLGYALSVLNSNFDGVINFSIYGTIEDKTYWEECSSLINTLPSNINVKYHSELKPDQVLDTFSKYDAFLFPTKGENFGHVIYESMAAGCIPIISDQTPWKGDGVLVHSLNDIDGFRRDISDILNAGNNMMHCLREKTIQKASLSYFNSKKSSGYKQLFNFNIAGEVDA